MHNNDRIKHKDQLQYNLQAIDTEPDPKDMQHLMVISTRFTLSQHIHAPHSDTLTLLSDSVSPLCTAQKKKG